jgi:hypothetical protein
LGEDWLGEDWLGEDWLGGMVCEGAGGRLT